MIRRYLGTAVNLIVKMIFLGLIGYLEFSVSKPLLQVLKRKTQFQKGGSDCAIAYAVDLCQGMEPAGVRYQQESMRPHLLQCLANRLLTSFPSNKSKKGKPASDVIDVFCTCRLLNLEVKKWHNASLVKNDTISPVRKYQTQYLLIQMWIGSVSSVNNYYC